jgi:nucleoside-diphosphate-sugar epimerase
VTLTNKGNINLTISLIQIAGPDSGDFNQSNNCPGSQGKSTRWLQPMLRGDKELPIQEGWAGWRWTHGFAEDVAEAVVLAAMNSFSAGRVYNVGERCIPTMAERLGEFARVASWRGRIFEVPASSLSEADRMAFDFAHHFVCDTTRIRTELGYNEVVSPEVSLRRTLDYEMATDGKIDNADS